jgi:HEXXH motif-containing protein
MHALEPGQFERAVSSQQRLLVTRFAALPALLQRSGGAQTAAMFDTFLDALSGVSADALLADGTPFFWMNVGRCASELIKDGDDVEELIEFVLATAFDSFFDRLPDDAAIDFSMERGCDLLLPKLGVRAPATTLPIRLRRVDDRSLEVSMKNGIETIAIRMANRPRPLSDPRVPISDAIGARILVAPNLSLVDPISALACVPPAFDIGPFRTMLAESLHWIATADPELAAQIERTIPWYVPIQTNDPRVHRSFTVDGLTGVMFLSESIDYALLAEAIVHEFYHTVLHIVGETADMFGAVDPNEKFYSPWRDDPRPLSGLLHAIYVFSGVATFYAGAIDTLDTQERVELVRRRQAKLYHQLRIALAQIPKERLTEAAAPIVRAIEDLVDSQAPLAADGAIMQLLESHLRDWCERNPALSLSRVAL